MSDADLRRTERAPSGDPAAEAEALAARVRAGTLERGRVVLAARLGDAAARLVAGGSHDEVEAELAAEAVQRVLIAFAHARSDTSAWDAWSYDQVVALRTWEARLLDPAPERQALLERILERACWWQPPKPSVPALQLGLELLRDPAAQVALPELGHDERQEVLTWALGRGDPVRARQVARDARARTAWAQGATGEAGCLIYQRLRPSQQVAWAAEQLALCLDHSSARPPALDLLLELAADPARWREGHAAFSGVRALTLAADRERDTVDRVDYAVLFVAETVAKLIYNASAEPAPFDHNAPWRVPDCARYVARQLGSPEFDAALDAAVLRPLP